MGPAERRNRLIKILCRRRHETIANLALEMEVSERTVRRDIAALSEVEPIYTQTGRHSGGVYVVDGYYSDGLFLTDEEITCLKVIRTYFLLHPQGVAAKDLSVLSRIIHTYEKPKIKKERKKQ